MISHEDLNRLATAASAMLVEPGLSGRVEPSCFDTETSRMANTYMRLSSEDFDAPLDEIPGRQKAAMFDAIRRAFRTGMAMGLAHHEEQRRELLIEFSRWSLQDQPEALAVIDTLKLGSFEAVADHFLEDRGGP